MWLVLILPPFAKLINSEQVELSQMSALCCASLRQIAWCETTVKFWYDPWVLFAGGGGGQII